MDTTLQDKANEHLNQVAAIGISARVNLQELKPYLVLSISDLKGLLKRAKAKAKACDNGGEFTTVYYPNALIDSRGYLQVSLPVKYTHGKIES